MISSYKKDDIVIANYRILYSVCCFTCGGIYPLYSDLSNKTVALDLGFNSDGSEVKATEEQMNAAYEKAPITKFTYEISNGDYYLKSVQVES